MARTVLSAARPLPGVFICAVSAAILFATRRRRRPLPRLGPAQGNPVSAFGQVSMKPAATLACPIVSALDRWLS